MTRRVALLYDTQAWVLSYIAHSLKTHVSRPGELELFPFQAPRKRRDLAPLLRDHDIIHYLSPGDFYRTGPAATKPCVVTVHHVATRVNTRLNALAHEADALTFINRQAETLTKALPGVAGIPTFFTPFGLDIETMRPHADGKQRLLEFLKLPADTILLGLAAKKNSNEDDRKGFDRYWKLLEKLRDEFGGRVRLVLFGPGSERPYGWSDVDFPEAVRGMVVPTGFVPSEDVPAYYSGLDFYVCLSRIEGGPYPVMECMACGTRVISTRVGIVEELIEDGVTGFLVDEGDYLTRIPQIIRENPRESAAAVRMRDESQRVVVEKRAWTTLADPDVYTEIYDTAAVRFQQRPFTEKTKKHVRLFSAVLRGKLGRK